MGRGNVSFQGLTVKQALVEIVKRLSKYRDAELFLKPVDHVGLNLTDYLDIIKKPMDLETLSNNVQADVYTDDVDLFWLDTETIWANCEHYNGANSIYGKVSQRMRELARKLHDQYDHRDDAPKPKLIKEEPKLNSPVEKKSSSPSPRVIAVQRDEKSPVAPRPPLPVPPDQRISSIAATVCARILHLNEIAMALVIKYLCTIQSHRDQGTPIIRSNSPSEREQFPLEFKDDPRQSLRLDINQLTIKELKALYMLVERLIEGGACRV